MGYNRTNHWQKAIALEYLEGVDVAPKISASGRGVIAEQIIELANEHNVYIHEDSELAEILAALEVDSYIPVEIYSVVAKIIGYVMSKNKTKVGKV